MDDETDHPEAPAAGIDRPAEPATADPADALAPRGGPLGIRRRSVLLAAVGPVLAG